MSARALGDQKLSSINQGVNPFQQDGEHLSTGCWQVQTVFDSDVRETSKT